MRKTVLTAAVLFALAPRAMAAETGQSLYNDNCAACHQRTGVGIKGAFPALTGGKLVTGPLPVLVATVLNGRGGMPAFKSDLTDAQMEAVKVHQEALRLVMQQKMEGDGGPIGQKLVAGLALVIKKIKGE